MHSTMEHLGNVVTLEGVGTTHIECCNSGGCSSSSSAVVHGSDQEDEKDHIEVDLATLFNTERLIDIDIDIERVNGEKGREQINLSYRNKLSTREMDTLTAICDSFLPSIDAPPDGYGLVIDEPTVRFFKTSASMVGAPEHLAGLISQRLDKELSFQLRLSLLLLSTWIGTLIMCGRLSINSSKFPYLHRFSDLELNRRQQILLSWSRSWIPLLRKLFVGLKMFILFVFFTKVDENHKNPSWEAIGYCGPDPEFAKRKRELEANGYNHLVNNECLPVVSTCLKHLQPAEVVDSYPPISTSSTRYLGPQLKEHYGPLYDGIVNISSNPREMVAKQLRDNGFSVFIHPITDNDNSNSNRNNNSAMSSTTTTIRIRCDAVVVGSGSGGGVVAGLLANAGYKVLVLEKGSYLARNNLSLLEGDSLDQMYEGGGLLTTRDVKVKVLAGSTVGGGSTINWSASFKTPKHVLNEWTEEHELELFSSPFYQEALDAVCEKMGVQDGIDYDIDHEQGGGGGGGGGTGEGLNNEVLRRGCKELGYPVYNIPRNSPSNHYCGWCCMGCKDGKKKGNQETWLKELVESKNGAILPNCEVLKVLTGKGSGSRRKAQGVAFAFKSCCTSGREDVWLVESKVTVVACGALNTPPLLRKSGLKNPNIGKNLHLHPVVLGWGYFPPATPTTNIDNNNNNNNSPDDDWIIENKKKSYEGGIMTAVSPVPINIKSSEGNSNNNNSGYGVVIQTPSLHPGLFSGAMPWISDVDFKVRMSRFSRTAHLLALVRDKGSGEVVGTNPNHIRYDGLKHEVDRLNLKRGREKMLRILAAAGAEEIGTHDREGSRINLKTSSSHEFERFVKSESNKELDDLSTIISSAHQMGSCRMGVDPKTSVVQPTGETWEVEGLYVADSSVFPTALGINPMVTVMATSYCTAQSVLEVLKRKRRKI